MQFPVPQFTDVEDKIIGSLTFKQFGIIFAAGIIIFLGFSATKSIGVLVVLSVLVGLPALGIAFAQINGRPMYKTFPLMMKFITSPKILVFHKESNNFDESSRLKDAEIIPVKIVDEKPKESTQTRISEINKLLEANSKEEKELLKKA